MSKRVDATTMTAETASKTEATKGKPEPAFRKPNQTRAGRQRQEMVAAYVSVLGGKAHVGPIVMQDIERAVDLVLLARDMRAAVRQGTAKVSDLTRMESTADRAVRRLGLPAAGAAVPVQTLHDIMNQEIPPASEVEDSS
jgi:hypothetical protein